MASLLPVVRYLILCEKIPFDPVHPRRVSLTNLIGRIRSHSQPPFPHRASEFCVYAQLTECRGDADVLIQIEEEDTQAVIFQTPSQRHSFGNDPLHVFGIKFPVRDCVFPSAGLYSVQLCYNGIVIAREPLKVVG
jgi:hypothetical protein